MIELLIGLVTLLSVLAIMGAGVCALLAAFICITKWGDRE